MTNHTAHTNPNKKQVGKLELKVIKQVPTAVATAAKEDSTFPTTPLPKTEQTEQTEQAARSSGLTAVCSEDSTEYLLDGKAKDSTNNDPCGKEEEVGETHEEEESVPWRSPIPRSAPVDIPTEKLKREELEYC